MHKAFKAIRSFISTLTITSVLLACASNPPVQEMSDARQAIKAAREVDAAHYAPDTLVQAENYLSEATSSLEAGAYESARQAALAAKEQAIRARDAAVSVTTH